MTTTTTTAASLPKQVPPRHKQEDYDSFVIKATPEGSLRGFSIPCIGDHTHMEPCTLWEKFLAERREVAFAGPQVRTRMGQQPAALDSMRSKQPLLSAGRGKEVAFQYDTRMVNSSRLSFDEVAFTEDMSFPAAWTVQHKRSLRGQRRVLGQILAEMTERLQPLQDQSRRSATPHQHKRVDVNVAMVITIMFCSRRQANMLPTEPLKDHNVVSTIATTEALEDCPEKEPPTTIKNCSARTTVRASLKARGKDIDKHAGASFQSCREEVQSHKAANRGLRAW